MRNICLAALLTALGVVFCATVVQAETVAVGEAYLAPKVAVAPVIDGILTEFADSPVIVLSLPNGTEAKYRIMYDDEALYVSVEATDTCIMEAGAPRDGALWEDDALEFMLDTLKNGGAKFGNDDYKFFLNVAGTKLDQKKSDKTWNPDWPAAVLLNGTLNNPADKDIGYTMEAKFPWSILGFATAPEVGTAMGYELKLNDRDATGVCTSIPFNSPNHQNVNIPDGWGTLLLI